MRFPVRAAMPLVLAVVACPAERPLVAPIEPVVLDARADPNPFNTISAAVVARVANVDSVWVRYWTGNGPANHTPPARPAADSLVRLPVLGLDTLTTYTFEVLAAAGTTVLSADTVFFTTGRLPAWIPTVGGVGPDPSPGLVALSLPQGAIVIDNEGRVLWYRETLDGTLTSFQAHPDGRYSIAGLSDTVSRFAMLDVLGNEVATRQCVGRPTRFHDVSIAPTGDAWVMCDDVRVMDLTAVGGLDSVVTTWTVVQHVGVDGTLFWEWNAFDHFQITDLPAARRAGNAATVTHGNGIALDADGNLLVSFRELDEVTKVDVSNGTVIWRLGGLANEFTITGDARAGFARQHGLRPAGPGQIQMLDNRETIPSRLARYQINAETRTALLVMDARDSPTTYTPIGGNSQYYPNGRGLVSFGRAGRILETDAVGNTVWEVAGRTGVYVFRAQRIPSLYAPRNPVAPPFGLP